MFFLNNLTLALNQELYVRLPSPLVPVEHPIFKEKGIRVWMKREDQIHPLWGGNKYRKLKLNFEAYRKGQFKGIVTFGGAHSNHIYACAALSKAMGIPCHGIIRGEAAFQSPTLEFAIQNEMLLHKISRSLYKTPQEALIQLGFDENYYVLPEGGTNELAIQGCSDISREIKEQLGHWPDHIVCSFGTGGTAAGILQGMSDQGELLIFPALKGEWIKSEMERLNKHSISNFRIYSNAHFGGYGKIKPDLIEFIQLFYQQTNIPLDAIYTGKMVYGFMELLAQDEFKPGTEVVIIHSGGLQGNRGINERFGTHLPIE